MFSSCFNNSFFKRNTSSFTFCLLLYYWRDIIHYFSLHSVSISQSILSIFSIHLGGPSASKDRFSAILKPGIRFLFFFWAKSTMSDPVVRTKLCQVCPFPRLLFFPAWLSSKSKGVFFFPLPFHMIVSFMVQLGHAFCYYKKIIIKLIIDDPLDAPAVFQERRTDGRVPLVLIPRANSCCFSFRMNVPVSLLWITFTQRSHTNLKKNKKIKK